MSRADERFVSRLWNEWWTAVGFLTVLPAPQIDFAPDRLGRSARWFPIVGLILGVLLFGADILLRSIFPDAVRAVLVVGIWAALTGGLHLDGLADCCDGFFAPVAPVRRLEIMSDPRLGTFGALGLFLHLALKIGALASLPALLVVPVWARWFLLIAARQPAVRPGGLGAAFAAGLTPASFVVGLVAPLALLVLMGDIWRGVAASAAGAIACLAALRLAHARIGGVTGDVFGFVVELCEGTMLLLFVAFAHG
jgi:adenosylcobinamide-GDP ribazoletransferase